MENHRRPQPEGQDPELAEFNAPATVEDGLGDEETTLLDGEVMTPDIVGHEARAPEGSDHDEDPNA